MKPKSYLLTSVHVKKSKCYIFRIVSKLALCIQAYNIAQSRCFLRIIIVYDSLKPELPQFMLNKVNVTFLGPFLSLHCVCKLVMRLNRLFSRIIIV